MQRNFYAKNSTSMTINFLPSAKYANLKKEDWKIITVNLNYWSASLLTYYAAFEIINLLVLTTFLHQTTGEDQTQTHLQRSNGLESILYSVQNKQSKKKHRKISFRRFKEIILIHLGTVFWMRATSLPRGLQRQRRQAVKIVPFATPYFL